MKKVLALNRSSGPGLFANLSSLSKGFGGTAGLVVLVLNFGVIQYHGDPRELFGLVGGESAEAAEEIPAKPSVSSTVEPSTSGRSAVKKEEPSESSIPSQSKTAALTLRRQLPMLRLVGR